MRPVCSANVSFYCRESKKNRDGLAPIELVIILNTRRCFIQLPRKEYPADLIEYLDGVRARLNQIATAFLMEGRPLTSDALKTYFQTGGYLIYTIENLFDDYMHILSKRVGKDLTPKSYRKYEIARDKFYKIISPKEPVSAITKAVILDQGVEILKKYNFKLPILGNHKLNVYLKAIRDLCGIDKPIFSHVARHTYATRCLNRGIRLEVVAKLLGHSTTKITQHYAKLLKNSILDEVKDAFENTH